MRKPLLDAVLSASVLSTAALSALPAQADDPTPGSDRAIQFNSTRSRAEVAAEAARIPATRSNEPAGSRVFSVNIYAPGTQVMGAPAATLPREAVREDYLRNRMQTAAFTAEDSGSAELSRRGWGSLAPRQSQQ